MYLLGLRRVLLSYIDRVPHLWDQLQSNIFSSKYKYAVINEIPLLAFYSMEWLPFAISSPLSFLHPTRPYSRTFVRSITFLYDGIAPNQARVCSMQSGWSTNVPSGPMFKQLAKRREIVMPWYTLGKINSWGKSQNIGNRVDFDCQASTNYSKIFKHKKHILKPKLLLLNKRRTS